MNQWIKDFPDGSSRPYVWSQILLLGKTVADLRGGRRGRAPPGGPNSFDFMQFLGNFSKIVCWRPPWGVGTPSSGKSWIRHCKSLPKLHENEKNGRKEAPDPPLVMLNMCIFSGSAVVDPGGGAEGAMASPCPVKIGHKKDGRQRRPHRFHVSRPPPLPGRWIRH